MLWSDDQVAEALEGLPGWSREGAALVRTVQLASFVAAIAVVDAVAVVAEARDHHPDIDIRYRRLVFRCTTHWKGGITAADADLAGEIDRLLAGADRPAVQPTHNGR